MNLIDFIKWQASDNLEGSIYNIICNLTHIALKKLGTLITFSNSGLKSLLWLRIEGELVVVSITEKASSQILPASIECVNLYY